MRVLKRYTISVTFPACDLTGQPESTETLVATADIETMMSIWDPFYAA